MILRKFVLLPLTPPTRGRAIHAPILIGCLDFLPLGRSQVVEGRQSLRGSPPLFLGTALLRVGAFPRIVCSTMARMIAKIPHALQQAPPFPLCRREIGSKIRGSGGTRRPLPLPERATDFYLGSMSHFVISIVG